MDVTKSLKKFEKIWFDEMYPWIVSFLGISAEDDLLATKKVENVLKTREYAVDWKKPVKLFRNKVALIVAPGPNLDNCLKKNKNRLVNDEQSIVIAVDGATTALYKHGILPGAIVGDLDGDTEIQRKIVVQFGIPWFIHVHGDNLERVLKIVNDMPLARVYFTCQVANCKLTRNFYGFTDGDRAE